MTVRAVSITFFNFINNLLFAGTHPAGR